MSISPPALETMKFDVDGDVGTLTLNRPDSFNAMSPELIVELSQFLGWVADVSDIKALVITGAGAAFCAGGDINWFKKGIEDPEINIAASVRQGAEMLHLAIVELQRIPVPVIAAINGPAAGAGFSLALACDIRICSDADSTFFACAYGRIGASPDGGMTYFLPRVVGPSRAIEILLNDPNMSAADALKEGLVTEVVPADELMDRVKAKAEKLGAKSPYYVRNVKELVHGSLDHTITEHLQLERHAIAKSMATEDLHGAVKAFLSGGKAEFHGK